MKHIIFDFDGTLVQSNCIKRDILIYHFSNICCDLKEIKKLINKTDKTRYQVYDELKRQGILKEICRDNFFDKLDNDLINTISSLPPKNNIIKVLDYVQSMGWNSYLSSATPLVSLEMIIKRMGWEDYFEEINGAPVTKVEYMSRIIPKVKSSDKLIIFGDGADDKKCADIFGIKFINAGPINSGKNLLVELKK
jgi:phosphoglycolate phosphatase